MARRQAWASNLLQPLLCHCNVAKFIINHANGGRPRLYTALISLARGHNTDRISLGSHQSHAGYLTCAHMWQCTMYKFATFKVGRPETSRGKGYPPFKGQLDRSLLHHLSRQLPLPKLGVRHAVIHKILFFITRHKIEHADQAKTGGSHLDGSNSSDLPPRLEKRKSLSIPSCSSEVCPCLA